MLREATKLSNGQSEPAGCESESDELLRTSGSLKFSSTKVDRTTPVATAAPSSERCLGRKPDFYLYTASHGIKLWPSLKSLLEEAGVDLKRDHMIEPENLPNSEIYSTGRDNDDLHHPFLISGDGFGARFRTSYGYRTGCCFELSTSKIDRYFTSFMERIYIMHPFLDATELRKSLDDFITRHRSEPRPHHADTVAVGDTSSLRGDALSADDKSQVPLGILPDDAMALVVLALGEICKHTEPLRTTEPTSVKGSNDQIYETPGLVYFAIFLKIMPSTFCSDTLAHAQVYLLAGLYMGQLARVKESMSWFTLAGKVLRRLGLQQKLYNDCPWTIHGDLQQELKESSARVTNEIRLTLSQSSHLFLRRFGMVARL
jgi:hypothetical protein